MGIFNNVKQRNQSESISKIKFDLDLTDYASISQFKKLKQEMESYLNRNSIENNKMNKPLDMGGNEIINLGSPDKPNDAVSRRFVYRKVQDLVSNYNLGSIKEIQKLLQTERDNIEQLKKDLDQNSRTIIDLHIKIGDEISKISKALDESDEHTKQELAKNISIVQEQIKELTENMIKHDELKKSITEAENKLKNMYKLEIRTEINNLNDATAKRNKDLLDNFLSKFAEYKAELEKSASTRSDGQDFKLDDLKKTMEHFKSQLQNVVDSVDKRHSENYKSLFDLTKILEDNINNLDTKITEIEKNINSLGESLGEIKTDTTKRLDDLDVVTTKRLDDLAEVILKFKKGYKKLEKRITTVSREVFLFGYYNNKQLHASMDYINIGGDMMEVYDFKDKQLARTIEGSKNFFIMFGIIASRIIDYKNFIALNPDNKSEDILEILEDGEVAMVKARGEYKKTVRKKKFLYDKDQSKKLENERILNAKAYWKMLRGYFPEQWTEGFIVPLHKKGDINDPSNYRGITLLSSFDDIVILSETEEGLHKGLLLLENYCDKWRLTRVT
ncbi:myosin-8-like, partial [Ruditapes philippinarum]|uniref:myosin-8-like n=1 Tax=Ruditapes philippinarum TaxID=129788 RepID=UPI00295B9296